MFLAAGHWSRVTMVDSYAAFARDFPDAVACRGYAESQSRVANGRCHGTANSRCTASYAVRQASLPA